MKDNSSSDGNSGASAGNTPSYQNFSTDSAKEIIAKLQVERFLRTFSHLQGVWTEGNDFQAGEVGSSRKRGASPATNPSSKRRKEEGGSVDKETPRKEEEEMALATTPRPPPMRKKAILKMAEKTSLTPQPMEMCSPSPTRRLVRSLKEPSMMPRNIFCEMHCTLSMKRNGD